MRRALLACAACALVASCAPPAGERGPAPPQTGLLADLARLHQDVPGLESRQTDRGIVLTLGPGPHHRLEEVAEFLQRWPEQRVVIEGFAARTQAIKEALVGEGVEAQRIEAVGPSAAQLDGRIEIVLPHGTEGAAAGR